MQLARLGNQIARAADPTSTRRLEHRIEIERTLATLIVKTIGDQMHWDRDRHSD